MSIVSIGDQAQSFQLRRDNARLNRDLVRLSQEISSGRVADVTRRLRGDFSALSGIESGLTRLVSFETTRTEMKLETNARQASIGSVRSLTGDLTGALLLVQEEFDPVLVTNAARDAASRFASAVSMFNSTAGSRSLFAGQAVDRPALAPADTMLTAIEAEIALSGAATAADVSALVDTWFGPGGGFETVGYLGDLTGIAPVPLSENEALSTPPTANDMRVREALAAFAKAALVDRGALPGQPEERASLVRQAGTDLFNAEAGLVSLQAEIGVAEAQIDRAGTEIRAEQDALEVARSELIGIDPFETATALQSAEAQLRALYALTAKLSRLSLTEYL